MLLLAIGLASGCLAESAGSSPIAHPLANVANATVCADENPTGSNISRTVCREPVSPEERAASTMRRNALPASPFHGDSQATDTPGLRVYH